MPGSFSASEMPDVLIEQKKLFAGGNRIDSQRAYKPELNTLKAVLQNQTATPTPIMEGDTCIGVKIAYLKVCDGGEVENPAFSCDIEGEEIDSASQVIAPNINIVRQFSVVDDKCKDLFTFKQKFAEAMLAKKLEIEKQASADVSGTLYANIFPASSFTGEEPRNWDLSGVPYLYPGDEVQRKELTLSQMFSTIEDNAIPNPIIIGDGMWRKDVHLSKFLNKQGGAVYDEEGLYGEFGRWYFDSRNMKNLNNDYGRLIVFDPNNVVFWTKTQWDNPAPKLFGANDLWVWREPLMNIKNPDGSPMYIDARMKYTCVEGDNGNIALAANVELKLVGGFAIGEATCVPGDKGIHYYAMDTTT